MKKVTNEHIDTGSIRLNDCHVSVQALLPVNNKRLSLYLS